MIRQAGSRTWTAATEAWRRQMEGHPRTGLAARRQKEWGRRRGEVGFMTKTILIFAFIACALLLFGCTASDASAQAGGQQQGNGQQYAGNGSAGASGNGGTGALNPGNRSGMMRNGSSMAGWGAGAFGNMTDAQRQQMMQAWTTACDGKAVGDVCTVQNALGGAGGQINGTCSARGGNLTCMPSGMGGRNGTPGNGTAPQQNP